MHVDVNLAQLTYEGKDLYVGIDVHKKKWVVSVRSFDLELKTFTLSSPSASQLHETLKRYFPGGNYHLVYEAGFSGYTLFDYFNSQGIDIIVTPPNRIPKDGNRVKTDRIDSRKLAFLLSRRMLKSVKVPTQKIRELRSLYRELENLKKQRQQIKNFIRSLMQFYDHELKDSNWNKALVAKLKTQLFGQGLLHPGLQIMIEVYETLEDSIKRLQKYLKELSKGLEYKETVERFSSSDGIGVISAFKLTVFLFDRKDRFPRSASITHYVGLTPGEHSSGGKTRRGGITHNGDRRLRSLLIQLAWSAVRFDPVLQDKFERIIARGGSKQQAIVAVARKLLVRLYTIYMRDEVYIKGVIA